MHEIDLCMQQSHIMYRSIKLHACCIITVEAVNYRSSFCHLKVLTTHNFLRRVKLSDRAQLFKRVIPFGKAKFLNNAQVFKSSMHFPEESERYREQKEL